MSQCKLLVLTSGLVLIAMFCVFRDMNNDSDCVKKCLQRFQKEQRNDSLLYDCDTQEEGHKVVSFSFFGKLRNIYQRGLVENARLTRRLYPGWRIRVYVSSDPTDRVPMCTLTCQHSITICHVSSSLHHVGDVWRYLAVLDPGVSVMVSRDLDSRLSHR